LAQAASGQTRRADLPSPPRPGWGRAGAAAAMATAGGDAEAGNPFRAPPELEYFWHPGVDLAPFAHNPPLDHSAKIWDKATAASRGSAMPTVRDADLPMAPVPARLQKKLALAKSRALEQERSGEAFLATLATKPCVGLVEPLKKNEKDIRAYVHKKREIFLAHMSCDVKKAETHRLDEKARLKEEALAKSQLMLDEDAKRFEDLLHSKMDKERKCKEEAEKFTKLKQKKLERIKEIRQQIAGVDSDIGRLREVGEECARYKEFLSKLTPDEWKASQAQLKSARKARRRQAWIEERMAVVDERLAEEEQRAEQSAASEAAQEAEARPKRRGRRRREEEEEEMSRRERERAHRQKRLQRRREDEERRVESEYVEVSSEEEHELCFREPQQLVDSFTELEEKNLFLIHSSQETEQQLDELRHLYENSKREMGAKVQHLKDTVKAQEARIAQEQQRFEDLRRRHDEKADTRAQDRRVGDLKAGVRQLYARCCPHSAADHDRGPLQMLAEIEAEVEKLITGLQEYSELGPGGADLITELEKGKEKARRDRLREVSMREKEAKDERRLKASLERSQAPVFRKAGKQVMYRSPPLRTEQKVVEDNRDEEAMEDEHQKFGVHIDRKSQLPQTEPPAGRRAAPARSAAS